MRFLTVILAGLLVAMPAAEAAWPKTHRLSAEGSHFRKLEARPLPCRNGNLSGRITVTNPKPTYEWFSVLALYFQSDIESASYRLIMTPDDLKRFHVSSRYRSSSGDDRLIPTSKRVSPGETVRWELQWRDGQIVTGVIAGQNFPTQRLRAPAKFFGVSVSGGDAILEDMVIECGLVS